MVIQINLVVENSCTKFALKKTSSQWNDTTLIKKILRLKKSSIIVQKSEKTQ